MKKFLGIIALIIGFVFIIAGSILKFNNNTIGIIGGADGPTSIFIATKLNSAPITLLMVIGIAMVIGVVAIYMKRK